jgi:hypothetical protein
LCNWPGRRIRISDDRSSNYASIAAGNNTNLKSFGNPDIDECWVKLKSNNFMKVKCKVKCKVIPELNYIPCHKKVCGNGGRVPHTLNLSTRQRQVASFTKENLHFSTPVLYLKTLA